MTGGGPAETHEGPVSAAYRRLAASGTISADPAQALVAGRFDRLLADIAAANAATRSPLARLIFRTPRPMPVRGLYVWGGVGRGKTMLMDLFLEEAGDIPRRRQHFHAFMADMHGRVAAARRAMAEGDGRDPIAIVAAEVASEVRLIAFDEFSVTDIADAMLLGRLFGRLFDLGVILVATSNTPPDHLYEGGLNRALFLPFIDLLKHRCRVVPLGAGADYRLDRLSSADVYLAPLGEETARRFDRLWLAMAGPEAGPERLVQRSREIEVPLSSGRRARFRFEDLCARPLGAADYRLIARHFDTLFLEAVPRLGFERRNEAKRLINLVDVLYDEGVKLVVSADGEPESLYQASTGFEAAEFLRTASRLAEMRSDDYRHAPRRVGHDRSSPIVTPADGRSGSDGPPTG
jgi:cell division protein ZapE